MEQDKGTYEVLRMPYGKPATKIFQKEVEKVFKDCPYTVNLLDDIIVSGKNEHNHYLKNVIERCKKVRFKLNHNKCSFFQK